MRSAKVKNRMGVRSGVTTRFIISNKKGLKDPHIIFLEGKRVSKSVQSWIEEFPATVYNEIYKENSLELCSDAMKLFKTTLSIHYPALLQKIEQKKQSHKSRL